ADRSIEQLRADITKLQSDRDRLDERIGALEGAEAQREAAPKTAAAAPATSAETVRRLPVVRVGSGEPPATEGETIDENGGDPRPMVEATGPAGAKRGRGAPRSDDSSNPALSAEAKRDYEAALALVRTKQHDKALDALTTFLVRYPDHP